MKSQSNLTPIKPDAIYKLLPEVVRAGDGSEAILAYMEACAEEHNFFAKKMALLPSLQDPTVAGAFTPEDFGESSSNYSLYLSLFNRNNSATSPLTDNEKILMGQLQELLQGSLSAKTFQDNALNLLSKTVGAQLYSKYFTATNRQLIETSVYRNHIKGTQSSVYVLGRILGFIDLKVRELWTRFAMKDPSNPSSDTNVLDLASFPDEYPYWPSSEVYDGTVTKLLERKDDTTAQYLATEVQQAPVPDPEYDPTILNDGDVYSASFTFLTPGIGSTNYYLDTINEHNPFGSFTTDIAQRLRVGTYYLEGGDGVNAAYAMIPYSSGSGVKNIYSLSASAGILTFVVDNTSGLSSGQTINITGTGDFDGTFPILSISSGDSTVSIAYDGVVPSMLSNGYVYYSAQGFAQFVALTWGDWANGVEISVTPSTYGITQDIRLTGPQSKIKFKSSYFDLSMVSDIVIFPTLYPCVPVFPSGDGSLSDFDPNVTSTFTRNIVSVSGTSDNRQFPRLYLDSVDGLEINTFVKIDGVPSLSGDVGLPYSNIRQITQIDPITNSIVIRSFPGEDMLYNFDFSGSGTVTVGRLPSALPVTGSLNGDRQIASADQKVMDFTSFLELISTLRVLFESLRPITRTVRQENFGFLLRDNMLYAPLYAKDSVILDDGAGTKYALSVVGGVATWTVVGSGSATPVLQQDAVTYEYGQWAISTVAGQPVFSTTPYNATTTGTNTDVVYIPGGGYVYLASGALTVASSAPEYIVNSIHSDGTTDESVLETDKHKVVENNPNADVMSPDASSTDVPDPKFKFQIAPEDDLSTFRTAVEDIKTGMAANWQIPSDSDMRNIDEEWYYRFDGGFLGRDLRLRSTGVIAGIVEPLPSGILSYNYPIKFLDYSGIYTWRNRQTNVAYATHYTYDAGARVDTSLASYDGQIEGATQLNLPTPVPIPSTGSGVTPNGQSWSTLDRIWTDEIVRPVTTPSPYTSVTNAGGKAVFVFSSLGSLAVGMYFTILSGPYAGTGRITAITGLNVKTSLTYSSTDTGTILIHLPEAQLWDKPKTFNVSVVSANTNASDNTLTVRVVDNTGAVLASNSVPYQNTLNLSVSVSQASVHVQVGSPVAGTAGLVTLSRLATDEPLLITPFAMGSFLWGGGHRDAVEVTITDGTKHFLDYGADDSNEFTDGDGNTSWRGGKWSGNSGAWTAITRTGLPAILSTPSSVL